MRFQAKDKTGWCYNRPVPQQFSSRLGEPSPPNELSNLKAALLASGRPILDFSASNPTRVELRTRASAGELMLALGSPENRLYTPDPRGLLVARRAVAAMYAGRDPGPGAPPTAPLDPASLFLCASTSEAYGWVFKLLCDPGDRVLVPKPGYPLFDYLAGLEGLATRAYRLEYQHPRGWSIDLDSLAAGIADPGVRVLVLINPNNPTGSYVSAAERAAIMELCARHGVAIVSDEVFFPFRLEGSGCRSFLGEEGVLCFVLDGLSKLLGLPQLKLGWIAASGPERELAGAVSRLEIIADTYLSAGSPVMNALPSLLEGAGPFVIELKRRLAANLAALKGILEGPDSPHRVLRCEGGWTAIIQSPRLESEEELAKGLLLEEGLATQPGYFFDMESEAFFTASLILPPGAFLDGARRYRDFFARRMAS
jgi:aspartate/methionine/tyrosine aminotransferase